MDEKRHMPQPTKKRYQSSITFFITVTVKIILLSMVSWLLLIIWFAGEMLYQGSPNMSMKITSLLQFSRDFIIAHQNKTFTFVTQCFHSIHSTINTCIYLIQCVINSVLEKMNYQPTVSITAIIDNSSALIFGTLELILNRLIIFTMMLPTLASLMFIALVDGLILRDKRKFQAARESTFFHHRIKPTSSTIFFSLFLVYMSLPAVLPPMAILLPMILILSIFMGFSVMNYKKYV